MDKHEKTTVRISVRALVEFLLRSGDIDTRLGSGFDREAMLAGGRIHRKLQKKETGDYRAEVPLVRETDEGAFVLHIEGRADGIYTAEDGTRTVDEIKGVYADVEKMEEPIPVHLAQAKCYAAILAEDEDLKAVGVRMTYVNLETELIKYMSFSYAREELIKWYDDLVMEYGRWAAAAEERRRARDESIQSLTFPFPYRKGQKGLVASVYRTIKNSETLFLMAPTGVGKTLSVIYPAVQALREGAGSRIFYLAAKNQALAAPEEAFSILKERGLHMTTVRITAKEKVCPFSEPKCNPEECPYAKGHFDRVNEALFDALAREETFDRAAILRWAEERAVCPFEFTLDLCTFADAVFCDYNYAFDPDASLKRFFAEGVKSDAVFLVDEAHNLVDRAREMFSARIVKEEVLAAKKLVKPVSRKAEKALEKLNKALLGRKKELNEESETLVIENPAPEAEAALRAFEALEELFKEKKDAKLFEGLRDFYFSLRTFVRVYEEADGGYVNHAELDEDGHFALELMNVDPSKLLQKTIDKGRAAVFFSATLLPVSYYKKLLCADEDAKAVYAESSFKNEQRCIVIGDDVTTRYKARGRAVYERIARYIRDTALAKRGNYMVFFPSYKFLADVLAVYRETMECEEVNWVAQSRYMTEMDREIFLENFYEEPEKSLVGFTVMGGVFAEGIDLTGTRLVGAIVVGTGLPQVGRRTELLRNYFDQAEEGSGFSFAYQYPGINKVLQAAGRVIRTAEDEGVIVLLDSRFLEKRTLMLFPREWEEYTVCTAENVREVLTDFWREKDGE